jgi:hypothetical protein
VSTIVLLNKPYGVLSQFTPEGRWRALDEFIPLKGVYVAGRLDADSEGLLILTGDGKLQARIADPKHKLEKTYWVQVEGVPDEVALEKLRAGITLSDFSALPAKVRLIDEPAGAVAARSADSLPRRDPDLMAGNSYPRRQESSGPADDGGHRVSYVAPDSGGHRGGDAGGSGARSMATDRRDLQGFGGEIQ